LGEPAGRLAPAVRAAARGRARAGRERRGGPRGSRRGHRAHPGHRRGRPRTQRARARAAGPRPRGRDGPLDDAADRRRHRGHARGGDRSGGGGRAAPRPGRRGVTVWSGALGPGVTARVVLLRHGEPEATASGRCYGKLDVGLSDRGRAQVDALTPWLRDLPLRAVVASPRRRALESAERLTASWGLAVEVDPDVAELDFGAFEGLRYAEVEARYPELYARWMSDPTEVAFPGGESHAMLHARVMAAAERIRARARGGAVLVASHGGVVRTWVAG